MASFVRWRSESWSGDGQWWRGGPGAVEWRRLGPPMADRPDSRQRTRHDQNRDGEQSGSRYISKMAGSWQRSALSYFTVRVSVTRWNRVAVEGLSFGAATGFDGDGEALGGGIVADFAGVAGCGFDGGFGGSPARQVTDFSSGDSATVRARPSSRSLTVGMRWRPAPTKRLESPMRAIFEGADGGDDVVAVAGRWREGERFGGARWDDGAGTRDVVVDDMPAAALSRGTEAEGWW